MWITEQQIKEYIYSIRPKMSGIEVHLIALQAKIELLDGDKTIEEVIKSLL